MVKCHSQGHSASKQAKPRIVGLQSGALPPVLLCVTLSFRERSRTYASNQGHGATLPLGGSLLSLSLTARALGVLLCCTRGYEVTDRQISDPFSTNLKILISVIFFLARVYQKVPKESVVP